MSSSPEYRHTRATQASLRWSKRLSVQRYRRLCDRLIRMSPGEIGTRVWLRARKATALLGDRYGCSAAPARRSAAKFVEALKSDPPERLREAFDTRFFFGPAQRSAMSYLLDAQFAAERDDIVARAEVVGVKGVHFLGQRVPLVPGAIDWQADPRSHRRAWPMAPMEEDDAIRVADADVKYVWEINRHQFLTYLGRASWMTGEARFVRQAVALIDDWIGRNPSGRGVNWCSGLEVAVRSISWLWTMPYLLAEPDIDADFLRRWLSSIADHYDYLASHLSIYTDPTNHLIGEATALWMLCTMLPELPQASHHSARALKILTREIERQVTPDGVNCEHATSYHRFVLDFYLQIILLARRSGTPLPAIFEQRVEAMLDLVAALAGGSGIAPMIGDSDDARGVPFPELTGWNFRDLLSTGAVLFARPDWKRLSGRFAEVSLWLLGVDGWERYERLPDRAMLPNSRVFGKGGYCFFGAKDDEGERTAIFDVAPLGLWPNAAHGHADALSIQVRLNGKFFLTDPGTGSYFESRSIRDRLRQTAAHNTVSVDGLDQADIFDVFKWVNPMNVRLLASAVSESFDYASGMHDGYCRLRKPIKHYRTVLFIRPMEWLVVDRFEGEGEHLFSRHFNFAPGLKLSRVSSQEMMAVDPTTGSGLRLLFAEAAAPGETDLHYDDDGLWSGGYGQWVKAPRLQATNRGRAPLTLFTFVAPARRQARAKLLPSASSCRTELLANGKAVVCRRTKEGLEDIVLVNPHHLDLDLPGTVHTNGEFLFVRPRADGVAERAFLAGKGQCLLPGGVELGCDGDTACSSFLRASAQPARAQSANV